MVVLVIDAQGGGLGKQLIAGLKKEVPDVTVLAVGTNAVATSNMLKAGADRAATGENAVVVACRQADVIVGPVGICIADAMLGEITPVMAASVGASSARRILIPYNNCETMIVGVGEVSVGKLVQEAIEEVRKI
ncbi:MAG: DUF3842 family protein [Lachnospiraceae bacterium]|nr:DUF3842 family protein [Lachnospiraceae bacterium]